MQIENSPVGHGGVLASLPDKRAGAAGRGSHDMISMHKVTIPVGPGLAACALKCAPASNDISGLIAQS
jgi:hypothetical protein